MKPVAAIHVGKAQLGLDDETYRALLERAAGKRSARDLTPGEASAVIEEMRRLGFRPAPGRRAAAEGPYAGKLQALWIAAWNLGVVRSRDDKAMLAFCERQTGIQALRFLRDPADARRVIEALKAWLAREAGVDWSGLSAGAEPQRAIALAQWRRLIEIGAVAPFAPQADPADLGTLEHRYGYSVTGKGGFQFYVASDWVELMNALGRKLRAALSKPKRRTA